MATSHYKPRLGKDIRIKPPVAPKPVEVRRCARPDCAQEGTHKVPKSRNALNEHLWFCLEHARAHNEAWDYFNGMNEKEIEAFRIDAITGHRPTWAMGKRSARARDGHAFDDSFAVLGDVLDEVGPRRPVRQLTRVQIQALEVLNLEPEATLHDIKARYKELVKRFHPDANGGDRGAEERLKQVIKAYSVLRAAGLT
jgi:hypothetical protein